MCLSKPSSIWGYLVSIFMALSYVAWGMRPRGLSADVRFAVVRTHLAMRPILRTSPAGLRSLGRAPCTALCGGVTLRHRRRLSDLSLPRCHLRISGWPCPDESRLVKLSATLYIAKRSLTLDYALIVFAVFRWNASDEVVQQVGSLRCVSQCRLGGGRTHL